MGGMGFIENNKALCMLSVLINTHLLMAVRRRFFFASSACVYNAEKQTNPDVVALKESDAHLALAEDGYSWGKLFSEGMCRDFEEDFRLECRVARYQNVYGPNGTWPEGGRWRRRRSAARCPKPRPRENIRSKSGATVSRHAALCISTIASQGSRMIMERDIHEPINLGSSELVWINQLVGIAESFAGIKLKRTYNLNASRAVNCRNGDNTLIQSRLGWEPSTQPGLDKRKTYDRIESQVEALSCV
jgi:GDP-D-mannose 3', 5'-epimerase